MVVIFCATCLIFIGALYALYRVFWHHSKKHQLRHIVMLALTAVGAWWVADYLKVLINMPRPDLTNALFELQNIHSNGMPSGHAAFMFALAAAMYSFDRKAGTVLYVLAVLTGSARVLSGVHFWYDIVGGAVLGYFLSMVVVTLCKRLIRD